MKLSGNAAPLNNVRIVDMPLNKYGSEGRAIIRMDEAKTFIMDQIENPVRPFIIFVSWDTMSRMQAVKLARKFIVHCSPIHDFIGSRVTKEDAVDIMRGVMEIHGFDNAQLDGLLVLTDNKSSNFGCIMRDPKALQNALEKTIEITRSYIESAIMVDDKIVFDHYSNRRVSQRAGELYGVVSQIKQESIDIIDLSQHA